MNPVKILVLDTVPPGERGFLNCTVVRHLSALRDAMKDPNPLVFILLEHTDILPEQEIGSSSPSPELQKAHGIPNAHGGPTPNVTLCMLARRELSPENSPQVTAVLQYIQSLLGPFHLSMDISISNDAEGTDSSPITLFLSSEPDKALAMVLGLEPNRRYHVKISPENLKSFLKLLPILSEIGKRVLFWGEDRFLQELYQVLLLSAGPNSSQDGQSGLRPPSSLGQWSKRGNKGVIFVDRSIGTPKLEEGGTTWMDPRSFLEEHPDRGSTIDRSSRPVPHSEESFFNALQETLAGGKTICIPALPVEFSGFIDSQLLQRLEKYVNFLVFWGNQWNERTVSSLLDLSTYQVLGPAHKGKGLILQTSFLLSNSTLPIILAHEEIGMTLLELYRKLSPEIRVRPSWDDYFLGIARAVAERATCDRGRSGCVIVRDKAILVTGYVGSPTGLPHCDEVGHQMKKVIHEDGHITQHCVRTVHAEQNAICQAAKYGISLNGGTLYCKMTPCRTCAMLIINCGIRRVVCEYRYHAGGESEELFRMAGITIEFKHPEVLPYAEQ